MKKNDLIKYSILFGVLLVSLSLILSFSPSAKIAFKSLLAQINILNVEPVMAEDIYPMFLCTCCDLPLDKKNICCEMAEERIAYIDSLVSDDLSKSEIIMAYVKKYGVNSFADKEKAKDFKEELVVSAPVDRPIIFVASEYYDFGDVSQKAGKVYTSIDLRNDGKKDLVIDKLESSCGCTFASISYNGIDSPFFTMAGHGADNPEWDGVVIPAGQTARLTIMYDPDVHADFRGPATREIIISSNDPIDFEKKITVDLIQVD